MDEITTLEELRERIDKTGEKPALIFKHSTACPISARANDRVGAYIASAADAGPDVILVKVIESRPVSNAVADTLGVVHQSPQIILVDKGKAVWSQSHNGITGDAIDEALAALGA